MLIQKKALILYPEIKTISKTKTNKTMKANKMITRKDINGFYIKAIRGGYFAVISKFSGDYSLCCTREEAEKTLAEQVEAENKIIARY